MPVVAVINRKGGSGKSTLATHLAAYCSRQGLPVMLGDTDRNRSSQLWIQLRQRVPLPAAGPITGRVVDLRNVLRVPPGTAHVVLDTPGGLHGFDLARVVCHADVVLIPVCPSVFDREAAAACWAELKSLPRVASGRCRVAAVGMRVDARSKALRLLRAWAQAQDLPFVGSLRDAQTYVHCAESGLSIFDLPPLGVAADLAQWAPIVDWLQPVLEPQPEQPLKASMQGLVRPVSKPAELRDSAASRANAVPPPPCIAAAPLLAPRGPSTWMRGPQAPATPVAKQPAVPSDPAAARSFFDKNPGRPPGITIPGALDESPQPAKSAPAQKLPQPTGWAQRLDKVLNSVSPSRWLPRSHH